MIVAVPATDDPDDFTVELCSECGGLGTVDEEPDDLPDEEE
jgi:hypothetical protein